MRTHEREILIYYNPRASAHKKVIALAKGMGVPVRTFTFEQAPSTSTSWQQIIAALDIHPKQLLNKADPYYQEHIRGCDFSEECWIKVIQNNPELIKAPIALRGNKAILCEQATDIYKLQQENAKV
ncbi:MAG TPA: glutaredoxin [Phaeodactylibacter sp.]|nr:glutaredoxin [Phaeodactylibacter sp.]